MKSRISPVDGPASSPLPPASSQRSSKRAVAASWILPRVWSRRCTSSHFASGVTIRQLARLSSAVPHSTAFLPPAFIAMLPPMQLASALVGSTANTQPALLAHFHLRGATGIYHSDQLG